MLRLVNNLEFLRDTKSQSGVAFSPVTMDLAGLCRHTAEDTAPLLAQAGIQLRYQSSTEGLLIPGDAALLSRMLLGLLSNAAKAAPSGTVLLTLRRWGDRAVLTCTNSGSTPDDGQLSALLEGASPHLLPEPGEGAGMGLPSSGTSSLSTAARCSWSAGSQAAWPPPSLCPPAPSPWI